MTNHLRGSLYAIISGFLYGFVGYFGLSAIKNDLSVSSMLFWRFALASLFLCVFLIPKLKKIQFFSTPVLLAFVNGALFYACSTLAYFHASSYIGSGLAMVVFFTYPLTVMLLNFFLYQDKIAERSYWSMFFIVSGMILTVDIQSLHFDLFGIFLAVISGIFYAFYIVSSKRVPLTPEVSTFSVSLGCTLTFFFLSIMDHSLSLPATMHVWANLIGIGLIATVIPVLFLLYSLKLIDSTKASILSVLEPVFVVIFGVLLLGEILNPRLLLAIMLILGGALITLLGDQLRLIQSRGLKKSS